MSPRREGLHRLDGIFEQGEAVPGIDTGPDELAANVLKQGAALVAAMIFI